MENDLMEERIKNVIERMKADNIKFIRLLICMEFQKMCLSHVN